MKKTFKYQQILWLRKSQNTKANLPVLGYKIKDKSFGFAKEFLLHGMIGVEWILVETRITHYIQVKLGLDYTYSSS